jgi:hypothetical protein
MPAVVSALAPSTESKFLNALAASKLQYPVSSSAANTASLLAGYDEAWFTLTDTDKMTFTHAINGERSELRNLHNWNVNTTVQTAHANVAMITQAGDQVTIMQILDDSNTDTGTGPGKPLLRVYRNGSDGNAYATVKADASGATNLPVFNLGAMTLSTYYDCDITVNNGSLTVNFGNAATPQVDAIDVSYWNFPSYWKAGLYLQDTGSAVVRFNELTWPAPKLVVDDDFADANRANTGALQADWWSSNSTSGNSVEIDGTGLGLISGTSGRGIHGTFTPETLAIGETLTTTLTFTTPTTVGTNKANTLKIALMDYNDAGLAADLLSSSSSSNPLYENLPGYLVEFDVNKTDNSDDIGIRKHDVPNTVGRFLGTSGEWTALGDGTNVGYDFSANSEYEVVVSLTRTGADSMNIGAILSNASGTVLASHAEEDASGIANHFGMLGIWANGSAFGSVTSSDPDNGITISNAKVELLNLTYNQAPAFTFDSAVAANATQNAAYNGSIASNASDLEGDSLTFSKASGPDWLTVASNGDLGGTPDSNDIGANTFTVQVADASGSNTATLNITVDAATPVLVDDSFTDGDRTQTGSLDANWWSSTDDGANAIEIYTNQLGLVSGTSGRGIHGTFTPQTLAVDDKLTATLTFTTPATVASNKSSGFRIALMDLNNAGLAADLDRPNALYAGLPGYAIFLDVNKTDTGDDIEVKEHNVALTSGSYLAASGDWDSLGSSANADYSFAATTEYVVVIEVERTATDSMNITATLSETGVGQLDTYTATDDSGIVNNFGMLGIMANSGVFGSVTTKGAAEDNGITFSNVKIEVDGGAAVNQPPSFNADPITGANATQDAAYSGSIASDASDLEGDSLTFSKVSGPEWLTVASNGDLGGTPDSDDVGANAIVVQVADAGGSDTATLNITVDAAIPALVSDNFADEDRTQTGSLDANWWSSSSTSGNSVEIDANGLGLVSGTSGRGLHGTFSPQTLDIGGSVTATLTFTTPATVGTNKSGGLRFMDNNDAGLAADLLSTGSSSNPLYENLPGYMVNFDVNKTDGSDDTEIRKHLVPNTVGRFIGTSSSTEWPNMGSSADKDYGILANTEYVVVIRATRTGADTADIFSSLSQGGTLLDSHTETDDSGIANNFGMLGVWVNSGVFGSTNASGLNVDNGITITNVTVEAVGSVVTNQAPAFSTDPIIGASATQDAAYSGSIAGNAADFEGDSLTFSKVSGPDWLTVASNGDLGGTPDSNDLGANTFTVQVADAGGSDTATLNITVDAPFAGGTIVDDNFADEDRTKTGAPDTLDTNWWGSTGSSAIEIDANGLGLRSGTSGRGIHATFSPQTLDVGDSMTATLTFSTPTTVGTKGSALKFGLMDLDDPLLADDVGSNNPLWTGVPGYMIDFDVNTGSAANIGVREHDLTDTSGRFLVTTAEWDLISGSSATGYTFEASTSYVVVIKATRTNTDSIDIFSSLSLASGGEPIASHTASDVDGTIANNFGLLGVAAASNTFGSTNVAGEEDNGITFTNVTVETALDVSGNTPPTASDNSGSIDEDASIGNDVLTVSATDDSAISSFEIIAGNTGDAFSIDSTGLIEVASALDFATTPSYTLTVQVTDDGTPGLKDTATVTIAVNEVVSGFGSWASGFSLVSSIETGDDDKDGIENVLEYILGGDPTAADLSIIPNGDTNGANYELTFARSDDSEIDATTTVQFGSDLTAFPATTETVPAASGTVGSVTFTIVENGEGDDSVTASIPHGGATEFFGRVAGSLNP